MDKIKNKIVIIFVIALVSLYGIIYIIPKVTGALVSSYTAEYGELKITDDVPGYLVRNEKVYLSDISGKANPYVEGGTLVRSGTTVMEVTAGSGSEIDEKYTEVLKRIGEDGIKTNTFTVDGVGVVSFYTDGYESKITPENMEKSDFAYYSKLSQEQVLNLKRDNIAAGEPVFKLVDRTQWYMVCFVDKDHMGRYAVGDQITVEFDNDYVEASVYKVKKEGDKARIILSIGNYLEDFARIRVADISLVTSNTKGLIIENSSISKKKGVEGVYVKDKTSEFVFLPVQVLSSDGERSVIADSSFIDDKGEQHMTVNIYDEVLKNPK